MYGKYGRFKRMTKDEWLKKNGFSEDGVTYVVAGGNTFEVKDILKSYNCVFSKLLNWHSAVQFDLEDELEGFVFVPMFFDELYTWNIDVGTVNERETAVTAVKEALKHYRPQKEANLASEMKDSEWMGEVGDRIRKIPAKIVGKKEINLQYGMATLYTFESGNSVLCWFTSTWKNVEVGDSVLLSGTVKSLNNYGGQKQTVLTRCLLSPIE